MRRILLCATGLTAALLTVTPAFAGDSQTKFTCEEFATALADNATRHDMEWADERATTQPGKVLIIGAGQKFYIPRYQQPSQGLAPKSVWDNMHDYNKAYNEAYWRCFNATNITINVNK